MRQKKEPFERFGNAPQEIVRNGSGIASADRSHRAEAPVLMRSLRVVQPAVQHAKTTYSSEAKHETFGRIFETRQRRQEPHPRSHSRRSKGTNGVKRRCPAN